MTDSQSNSAAVGQPALQALQLSRVQQILRDVRDRLIVDQKHEEYNAGVCDACNDAIDAVTAEPGTAQDALRALPSSGNDGTISGADECVQHPPAPHHKPDTRGAGGHG